MVRLKEIGCKVLTSLGRTPERRLHNQARAIWQASRSGNRIPRYEDFDRRRMAEISEHGFLIEIGIDRTPLLTYAGDIILEEAGQPPVPVDVETIPTSSLLGRFGNRWRTAVLECAPVASEYQFTTEFGYRILCRGVLLPFSSDGDTVDRVYGVVSWTSKLVEVELPRQVQSDREGAHP